MNLTYRGVSYTPNSPSPSIDNPVDDTDTLPSSRMTIGKYRGAIFYISQFKLSPQPRSCMKLQYRGAPYEPALRHAIYAVAEMG